MAQETTDGLEVKPLEELYMFAVVVVQNQDAEWDWPQSWLASPESLCYAPSNHNEGQPMAFYPIIYQLETPQKDKD